MNHCFTLLADYLWMLSFLGIFGLAGGFLIIPFRQYIAYPMLAAPFAGLLFVPLAVAVLYTLLGLTIPQAIFVTILLSMLGTLIFSYRLKLYWPKIHLSLLLFIFCWLLLLTYACNYVSIHFASPGFLFSDGTDHLGYAQLADWLLSHTHQQLPILSPQAPYESWPYQMFHADPRFGGFYLLATITHLKQLPATFAYNFASGLILNAGILAVSAVFAKNTKTLVFCILGLTCAQWYPLAQRGYFGKIIAFPAVFFITGLFFHAQKKLSPGLTTVLAIITAASAICYPGTAIATLLVIFLCGYLLCALLMQSSPSTLGNAACLFILLILIALSMNGQLSHPFSALGGEHRSWFLLWQQLFELPLNASHRFFSTPIAIYLFFLLLLITVIIAVIAFLRKNALVMSLTLAPLFFIGVLSLAGTSTHCWIAYQLIGIVYPASLLGCICLYDTQTPKSTKHRGILLTCLVLMIGIHLPKFLEARHHYAGHGALPDRQYSKKEFDTLASLIGQKTVLIDVRDTPHALPLLVEFGRRGIRMRWTPASWQAVVGYQNWPAPSKQTAQLYLGPAGTTHCKSVYQTAQYLLCEQ